MKISYFARGVVGVCQHYAVYINFAFSTDLLEDVYFPFIDAVRAETENCLSALMIKPKGYLFYLFYFIGTLLQFTLFRHCVNLLSALWQCAPYSSPALTWLAPCALLSLASERHLQFQGDLV